VSWKESGVEIIVAIIGSGLIGTSVTTFFSDIYFQPFIQIQVNEHRNELSLLNGIDYYEILFKNTGQKYASNSQLNMFFFANITKYIPVIHTGNLSSNVSKTDNFLNSSQIKPSLLTVSLEKFPKNSIVLIYVWTKPWTYNAQQAYLSNEYYVTATYDEGSNHITSNGLQSPYSKIPYLPYLKEDSTAFVSLTNIPFVTIILSIIAFTILFKIRRLKQIKKDSSAVSPSSRSRYDLLFFIPIVFASSILIFFVEVYLKDIIFFSIPINLINFTNYFISINEIINIQDEYKISIFPFLIYGFFGVAIILIVKLFITYAVCKFILKFSLNSNHVLSFNLRKRGNRKLFLLCAIVSLPLYTIVDYFLVETSSYNLLILMMFVEFIKLLFLFYIYLKRINHDKLVEDLIKLSRIFCSLSGITYLVTSFFIVKGLVDAYYINLFDMNFQSISMIFQSNRQIGELSVISFVFFFIVGITLIIWPLFIRKKTRLTFLYKIEFAGLITLTIFWLILRIHLPLLLTIERDSQLGYPGLFSLIPIILNLGLIIITFQILAILIDYIVIKKDSIILRKSYSSIHKPKILIPLLSVVIVLVITPLILLTPVTNAGFNSLMANDYSRPSSLAFNDDLFYGSLKNSDCFRILKPNTETEKCFKTNDNSSILAMDVDTKNKQLILLKGSTIEFWNVTKQYEPRYNISKKLDLEEPGYNFLAAKDSLDYFNNTLFILRNNKIIEVDLKTGNKTSIELERIVKNFAVDPVTKDIFITTWNGYAVVDGDSRKEKTFTSIEGIPDQIEYDPISNQIFLSYRDFKDNKLYISIIEADKIIKRIETNGFPLKIGVLNVPESHNVKELIGCMPTLKILMYQPSGDYYTDRCLNTSWQSFNY